MADGLTPEQRAAILEMRRVNPKITYQEIAKATFCSVATAWKTINPQRAARHRPASPVPIATRAVSRPPQPDKYTSFKPDPAAMRGGRAHPLRRLSGAH